MKFRIIGSIIIVLLAIVMYALFSGGSSDQSQSIGEPSLQFQP